jgi:hypothetical protein
MSDEGIRRIIITVVWAVLALRTPFMVRDRKQRPVWLVLIVIATGSIVIQSWFGTAINRATGIPQFNNLLQGLWGILDVAVTLEFIVRLADGKAASRRQSARIAGALAAGAGMALCFALTPQSQRFRSPTSSSTFTAYALIAAIYMICAAGAAAWIMWHHLPQVRSKTLYTGLLLVMVGNTTEVPFMTIRTLQRLSTYASPELLRVALLLNTTRFILLPLGCTIAAIEPLRQGALFYYRRLRLRPLWRLLRSASPELNIGPPVSMSRDMVAFKDGWERLHRRVVEIRDSVFYLHDAWASAELLAQAVRYADAVARPEQSRLVAIACWLEATRREAALDGPKLHHDLETALLPELLADESTIHREMRNLRRLHRALRSRQVRGFTDHLARYASSTSDPG